MNTPAHLIFGAAAFGDPLRRGTTTAALLGGLAPDLSLYLMAGVALVILQIPPQVVFDELYFSDAWQTVFAIDNSVFVWGLVFALGWWRSNAMVIAFAGAGLIHLATDFALHHDDARAHFWPLSDWRFASPISYWDSAHHARWVAPAEAAATLALTVLLWRRYLARGWRALWILLAGLEIFVVRNWLLFF